MNYKIAGSTNLVNNVILHQDTVFMGSLEDVSGDLYNFTLDNWSASHTLNNSINNETKLEPAFIKPFGKWFDHHFKSKQLTKTIASYYEELISELDKHSNPEAGHYFERSWYAVFYPYKNIKII